MAWGPSEEQWAALEKPEKDAFRHLVAGRRRGLQIALVCGGLSLPTGLAAVICGLSIRSLLLGGIAWVMAIGLVLLFFAYYFLRRCFSSALTEEQCKVLRYLQFTSEMRVTDLRRKQKAEEEKKHEGTKQEEAPRRAGGQRRRGTDEASVVAAGPAEQGGGQSLERYRAELSRMPERLRQVRTAFLNGELTAAQFDESQTQLREKAERILAAARAEGLELSLPVGMAETEVPAGQLAEGSGAVLDELREKFLDGSLSEEDYLRLAKAARGSSR